MSRVLSILLVILNIAMFASMGLLIFKSNVLLNALGIPNDSEKEVEGFSFRNVPLAPQHAHLRDRVQTLGHF